MTDLDLAFRKAKIDIHKKPVVAMSPQNEINKPFE